ncbi:hypothetical protein LCGC14_3100530 [marine sediment metagenome]|uniref:Uncharacterized protein n=1 Tax=marine sediment metagenome TaxID=412755 RepID=A0A0F8W7X2_9ZZZZ|nr:hypothetical protein [bacterium]
MKCKKHPRYKGIYKPRTECLDCWKIYETNLEKKLGELNKEMDKLGEELMRAAEGENRAPPLRFRR